LAVGITAFFAVAVFMIGVGLLAAWIPAVRALRIQPTEALRTDA
jgi:ABC-type lipoprotein release transport system permease subunit